MADLKYKRFLALLAYVAVVIVAVALILQLILAKFDVSASVVNAMRIVGECIAYAVVCLCALSYVNMRRNTVLTIVYVACAVAIVILIILR